MSGTSTFGGTASALNPQTSVVVWARTGAANAAWVKIGVAPVDTTGNWSVRPSPAPSTPYTQYLVQSTRGGSATGALQLR